jgi:hypothetical protein
MLSLVQATTSTGYTDYPYHYHRQHTRTSLGCTPASCNAIRMLRSAPSPSSQGAVLL